MVEKQHAYQRHLETRKTIEYEKVGFNPKVLFFSGIHGDERNVIGRMRNILNRYSIEGLIPDHLRIFRANKNALKLGKRKSTVGDLNRHFKKESNFRGVKKIIEILNQNRNIKYVFSFHEETDKQGYEINGGKILPRDENSFYVYDAYNSEDDRSIKDIPEVNNLIDKLTVELNNIGIIQYNGLDDYHKGKKETVQGNLVINGYCSQPIPDKLDGTFENWVIGKSKVKRSIVFEIPSKISIEKKQQIMKIIFNNFIIPFLKIAN